MKAVIASISVLLVILYPIGIYFGLTYLEPRLVSLVLLAVLFLKGFGSRELVAGKQKYILIIAIGLIILLTVVSNNSYGLKLYPVLINFSLFSSFFYSLIAPPTIIERFARKREPELSPQGVLYTRTITKIWCVFFIFNGLAALYTSLFTSVEVWTLYNGLISYFLIGGLVIGEIIYRKFLLHRN